MRLYRTFNLAALAESPRMPLPAVVTSDNRFFVVEVLAPDGDEDIEVRFYPNYTADPTSLTLLKAGRNNVNAFSYTGASLFTIANTNGVTRRACNILVHES